MHSTTLPPSPTHHGQNKEPWLAVLLSTIFPGMGQLYAGQLFRGVGYLLGAIALLGVASWLMLTPNGNIRLVTQLVLAFVILSVINLFDAYRATSQANSTEFEYERKSDSDPWLAVFLSQIIPGAGHLYNRSGVMACLFFFMGLGSQAFTQASIGLAPIPILISFLCLYHAYITSPTKRPTSKQTILAVCSVLAVTGLLSVLLSFALRTYVLEARFIPSGSMEPTIQIDDRVLVNKITYRLNTPSRGDVIIFTPPPPATNDLGIAAGDASIQRIVGLPGETVEINKGQTLINNEKLEEPYLSEPMSYSWGPNTVPDNAYFTLGDNRNNSFDGHVWGFLPAENIIGQAQQIFWPPARQGNIE